MCGVLLMNLCHPYYPWEGLLTATLPGWTQCYCPLPWAKPGLLDGQPSRLVDLMASSSSGIVAIGRLTLKTEVILRLLTPEVSSSNSPGTAPGKWRPIPGATLEGLTPICRWKLKVKSWKWGVWHSSNLKFEVQSSRVSACWLCVLRPAPCVMQHFFLLYNLPFPGDLLLQLLFTW